MNHDELVTLNDENLPTTTSLKVAEAFGESHGNVMDSIKNIFETLKNAANPIELNLQSKD